MPDIFIIVAITILSVIALVCLLAACIEGMWKAALGAAASGVVAISLGVWLNQANDAREWTTTGVCPLQEIDVTDGSKIQVFIVGSRVYNATDRWGKIFQEGTWVRRLEGEPVTYGVRFWTSRRPKFETVAPNEGNQDVN